MNLKFGLKSLFMAGIVAAAAQAGAGVVSSMVGENNAFGITDLDGNAVTLADGADFDNLAVGVAFDANGELAAAGNATDLLYAGVVELAFSYALPADMASARIRMFTAGWGLNGQARVYFNNQYLGLLTDGDGRSLDPFGTETANLDFFAVNLAWLTGNDTLRIEVAQAPFGAGPDFIDLGAVDYAALDITTLDTGGSVPEPASLALTVLGLVAAGAASRRRVPVHRAERTLPAA